MVLVSRIGGAGAEGGTEGKRGGKEGEGHPMEETMRRMLTGGGLSTRGEGGREAAATQEGGRTERRERRVEETGRKVSKPEVVIGADCKRARAVVAWPRLVMVG